MLIWQASLSLEVADVDETVTRVSDMAGEIGEYIESRIQADIDSMQARLKSLKGQVDLATIDLSLKRKRILGPLGHLFRGAGWVLEKLFVIQE